MSFQDTSNAVAKSRPPLKLLANRTDAKDETYKGEAALDGASQLEVEVREHLGLILASEWFANSPRMSRFLEFVVGETLAGRMNQLCEYAIGVAVFDQGDSFRPSVNPIVRNDARRLRHKLHEYYRNTDDTCGLEIEIPKGSYFPCFQALFPQAGMSGKEWPSARFRLSIDRGGQQLWIGEYECKAGETIDIQLTLASGT